MQKILGRPAARIVIAGAAGLVMMILVVVMLRLPVSAHREQTPPRPAPLVWHACDAAPDGIPDNNQECAELIVPLDYRNPRGKKMTIAVSRILAGDPAKRRGVLLSNPGGPGGNGLDMPRLLSAALPKEISDSYDLIGFDPRGVGKSGAVSCGLTVDEAFQAYLPMEQLGGFDQTAAFMKQAAGSCMKNAGATLPYLTTANTARDMEQIRQALSVPKISFFGISYGTILGATYASLYPDNTDKVVLDSVVNPKALWREQFRSINLAAETRFVDFATFAAAGNDTYRLGADPAEVRQTYLDLIGHFDAHPTTVPGQSGQITGGLIRHISFGALYHDFSFLELAIVLQSLKDIRDNPELAKTASSAPAAQLKQGLKALDVPPEDNNHAAGLAVICNDVEWPQSLRLYKRDFEADAKAFPLFGKLGSNIWPCAFWKNRSKGESVAITANGPSNILLVQNTRDPATPQWGAIGMREALGQRARLVVTDQGGHGNYLMTPDVCAFDIVTKYLSGGPLPALDQFCPAPRFEAESLRMAAESPSPAVKELSHRMRW